MKKLFIILAILSIASLSFAAWGTSLTINGESVTLSKNVHADYAAYGGTNNNDHYVAGTYNDKGTRAYGGSDEINTIRYTKCTDNDCGANAPTAIGTSSSVVAGWSEVGD